MDDKQKEERGPKSPGVNLAAAVDLLRQVRDGVGLGRASRATVAEAMGYGSLNGRSNRAIASLVHFGLVDRAANAALQISDLGKRVLMPKDEHEAHLALAEAVKNPALYEKLFKRFGGHGLPALLPNILVREFGVLPNSSDDVARLFRESAEYAGLLRHGILQSDLVESRDSSLQSAEGEQESDPAGQSETVTGAVRSATSSGGLREDNPPESAIRTRVAEAVPLGIRTQRYTIPLHTEGRVAILDLPAPVLSRDWKMVRRWADYMLALADDEDE